MPSHQSRVTNHQSLRALLADGIAQLESAQIPSAALAAELLLMHALQRDRAWIYAHSENEPGTAACEHYLALISRRTGGVPTQHLTGHQEFWGLEFEVSPEVLIPRPETEHLIEVALDQLGISDGVDSPRRHEKFQIVDVGTGSGCIAVALAHELPVAQFIATDISGAALKVASRNAERHGVAPRIDFIECDLLEFSEHRSRSTGRESRRFDLIVSNPPYIGRHEADSLPREVREHEPEAALFGGESGAEIYAPLIVQAAARLKPAGFLIMELGHDSLQQVTRVLDTLDWTSITTKNDLAGIPRVIAAQRRG